jgi:5'-3' exonuclease
MGIPVYFKTIVQEYESTILKKDKLQCNSLFLDLNCAIHPCCSGETSEEIMIQKIISKINELVDYTNVSDLLYIAIDGIPPKGKMKQQRMRRHKSILENKSWDTNAITPGTYFMEKLNHKLKDYKNDSVKKIIISDSDERGEGEHKILQYIKHNTNLGNNVIYGLDADLIMLSMVSGKDNIYLLRERTEYNIEDTDNDYIYLIIDELKKKINKICNINDYIFLCFLLGNDFINHLPSLCLRYGGYDILLDTYQMMQERYSGYFCLIDLELENVIHLTFLKEFIYELLLKEKSLLQKKQMIREKQYKRAYQNYSHIFHQFSKKSNDIDLNSIYKFQNEYSGDKDKCKEMINNLPILYFPEEKNHKSDSNPKISEDYLDSLIWTSHYYFKECINWKYSTQYDSGPFLKDFSEYLMNLSELSFMKDSKEYTITEQLKFIFPRKSHKLHKHNISVGDYKLKIDLYGYRYLWECPIVFSKI